MKGRKNK